MNIDNARGIVDALKAAGIDYVAYLPDSFFFEVLQLIRADPDLMSIAVCNESTGLCMCAGAWLGGKKPVMIMENSGILVSAYGITRLLHAFGIPILILSSWRGEAGDAFWWSSAFTRVNEPVLRGLAIPFVFAADAAAARTAIVDSQTSLSVSDEPRAVICTGVGKW